MADEVSSPVELEKSLNEEKTLEKEKLDSILTQFAEDYSKYLNVDATSEKTVLDDEIEDILTRLDEFTSLVDMVRGDNALCLNQTLPEIYKKYQEMETMFFKIDKMEEMVKVVKQNLDVLEDKVNIAEEQLDSSSVKKLFNSLQKPLFSKKGNEPKKHIKYEPPEIFKAEVFFAKSSTQAESSTDIP